MIDEEELRAALREAAGAIVVPQDAPEHILTAAQITTPHRRPTSLPAVVMPHSARGRALLVAAAVVVIAGGITLFHTNPGGSPSRRVTAGPAAATHSSRGSVSPQFGLGKSPATAAAPQSDAGTLNAPSPRGGVSSVPPPTLAPLPTGAVGQSAKVETTGSVDLAIGNGTLTSVVTKLTNLVTGDGGFVAKSQVQVGTGLATSPSYATVVLQVPEPSFSALLTQVQGVAKVTSVASTSTDVTGQYVDLQARITALQASRQQYLTILARATSIGDVLAVQSQLDALQAQIEQLQGQLNVLDGQTNYGTLTVSLSEAGQHPVPAPQPRSGLSKAWHDGISGFVSGFEWLVRIAGPTLFVLLLLAAVAAAGRLAWRAYRRRML
jgi:hypothetical protein